MQVMVKKKGFLRDRFAVVLSERGNQQTIGEIFKNDETQEWEADTALRRCLEVLVSNSHLREGKLGPSKEKAMNVATMVGASWYLLMQDSLADKNLRINKLDIDTDDFVEVYPGINSLGVLKS